MKYKNAIMFAKISGGQLPGLPVPGCGPGIDSELTANHGEQYEAVAQL